MDDKPLSDQEQNELNWQLGKAAVQNNIRQIEKCISAGAQIDALCIAVEINGYRTEWITPLHAAVSHGSMQAVKALLENGADINVYSIENPSIFLDGGPHRTPLHSAAYREGKNGKEITALLLAAGANVHLKSIGGETASDIAIRQQMGDYLKSIENDPSKRPTPESVGLDIKKRNAALAAMGKAVEDNTEEVIAEKLPETPPKPTLTPEEIIRRQQQRAIENDEGI